MIVEWGEVVLDGFGSQKQWAKARRIASGSSVADAALASRAKVFDEFPDRLVPGNVRDFVVTMPGVSTITPAKTRSFEEHECVRLVAARPDARLSEGAVGAVVHVYRDHRAYEVEFPDAAPGMEVLTLAPEDLAPFEA